MEGRGFELGTHRIGEEDPSITSNAVDIQVHREREKLTRQLGDDLCCNAANAFQCELPKQQPCFLEVSKLPCFCFRYILASWKPNHTHPAFINKIRNRIFGKNRNRYRIETR